MKRTSILISTILLLMLLTSCDTDSNSMTGLWEMTDVKVGEQQMTPIARWTRIHSDGIYETGNGWIKNSEGTWTFDNSTQEFLPIETNGIEDPFGAFEVSFVNESNGNSMIWVREEDGMMVEVTLKKIENLPKAPADNIQGLWDLTAVESNGTDAMASTDSYAQHYLLIRWDRIYEERTIEGGRQTGYWHMNSHSPEVTLMSHSSGENPETWRVDTSENNMLQMTGLSNSNRDHVLTYTRLNQFPE